ncbi:uncharacterized protein LOC135384635 [Ornithodoros turicata]|uniref:uncharacterized protein LOC135384635 n=1 Tax=Ornithodoros turicata TaxID=34597 RepID=UPI0031389263
MDVGRGRRCASSAIGDSRRSAQPLSAPSRSPVAWCQSSALGSDNGPRSSTTELMLGAPDLQGPDSALCTEGDPQGHEQGEPPFQVVTHKESRPGGIPVVFRCKSDSDSFWNVNPDLIAHDILTATQEKVLHHRINKQGTLILHVSSEHSARRLLSLKSLSSIPVEPRIPASYTRTMGRISGVPRRYSEDQLLEFFKPRGVTAVKREMAFSRESDGSATAITKSSVLLTFQTGLMLPAEIPLGFTYYRVSEYIDPPVQCFNCQKHGHYAKACRGPQRCKVCSGPHDYKECTARLEPKCANYAGPHTATFRACKVAKAAAAAHRRRVLNGKASSAPPDKRPSPVSADHFPSLPEPSRVFPSVLRSEQTLRETNEAPRSNLAWYHPKQKSRSPL